MLETLVKTGQNPVRFVKNHFKFSSFFCSCCKHQSVSNFPHQQKAQQQQKRSQKGWVSKQPIQNANNSMITRYRVCLARKRGGKLRQLEKKEDKNTKFFWSKK